MQLFEGELCRICCSVCHDTILRSHHAKPFECPTFLWWGSIPNEWQHEQIHPRAPLILITFLVALHRVVSKRDSSTILHHIVSCTLQWEMLQSDPPYPGFFHPRTSFLARCFDGDGVSQPKSCTVNVSYLIFAHCLARVCYLSIINRQLIAFSIVVNSSKISPHPDCILPSVGS